MNAHNVVFTIDDGPDRYRVEFDNMQKAGMKWTVYVRVNGVDRSQKVFQTNREPDRKNARYFAGKY